MSNEQEARQKRLQQEHEEYISAVMTTRHMPQLQSTIAGAGNKTNQIARAAEEREAERMRRLQDEAAKLRLNSALTLEVERRRSTLEAESLKRKARRDRKKAKKRRRSSSSSSSNDSEKDDGEV
jgi:hypothetical protein